MTINHTEFLIVGAGIVGLTLARELVAQGADKITLLEKELTLGHHASGRNSGVLHAGIYYPPDTLKAQLCLKGNLSLQDYCRQKNLPLLNAGKVIVARTASELPILNQLYKRAKQNGAKVDLIDEHELSKIEPHAKTIQKAIYSHNTAIVCNQSILSALQQELIASNKVKFIFNSELKKLKSESSIQTSQGEIYFKQLINTAGAYADQIAHLFDVGKEYYLIPFKGIYKKLTPDRSHLVNGNIYPVPNLGNPFLGMHFTKNIQGDAYVGPTAIPAFGRENYGLLSGLDKECGNIFFYQLLLFCSNAEFRKVAFEEPKKYFSSYFFNDAKQLVKELRPEWLKPAAKVGIRPQLIHVKERKLMMDFLVVQDKNTLHILNAISPAFTSSMAFAKYIIQTYYS